MSAVDLHDDVLACRRSNKRLNLKLARVTRMMLEMRSTMVAERELNAMLRKRSRLEESANKNLCEALKHLMAVFEAQQGMIVDLHTRLKELEKMAEHEN